MTVACFALPAFLFGVVRAVRPQTLGAELILGREPGETFRPEGSGHCVSPLESRPPTRTRVGMEGGPGACPRTVGSADRWAKRSAERGEGRSPNGVEEGGRGAAPPRVQGGALARP